MRQPFILLDDLYYVVPAYPNQLGDLEEAKLLTGTIARAVATEHAFVDMARRGKIDWLNEISAQIKESWDWVETCFRERPFPEVVC